VFWDWRRQKPEEERRDQVPKVSLLSAAARNSPWEKTNPKLLEVPWLFLDARVQFSPSPRRKS